MRLNTLLSFICIFYFTLLNPLLSQNTGDLYVSDAANFEVGPWKILKYDRNGNNPEVFIDTNLGWPQDILFLEDQGIVLVSNLSTNKISTFDAETGDFIEDFATGISGPTRMKIGPDGFLYVLQWSGNGRVLRYNLNGNALGAFTATGIPSSIGLDWDIDGNLYVSSYSEDNIVKFDKNGRNKEIFADSKLAGPTNIYFNAEGELVVFDYDAGNVKRYNKFGNFLAIDIQGLSQPEGVAFMKNGDLLLGNGGTGSVKRYRNNNFVEDFVSPRQGGLIRPNAVVIREETSVSTENLDSNFKIVSPNFGRIFNIDQDLKTQNHSIKIYNTSGTLIKTIRSSEVLWDAQNEKIGYYYLVVQYEEGRNTQRVLVK